MRTRILLACLAWGLSLLTAPVCADTTIKRLAPGVTLTQEIDKTTPLVINVLDVDLRAPGVHLGVGIAQDHISGTDPTHGREDVSRYTRRHHVLAAVNADFFPYTGDPLGVGIKDGELFSEPWTGNAKAGARVAMGVGPDGRSVAFDVLGFLGDLQTQDGQRAYLNGIDRAASANEIVAYTPLYGPVTGAQPGGTEVIVERADLPVRANKLIVGQVRQVLTAAPAPAAIPQDGFVLSGAPGTGADFLAQHVHVGERVGFVPAVGPPDSLTGGVRIASLPRTASDLPSRAGAGVSRPAYFWANVPQAVGGGPRLLVNGQVAIDGVAEGFDAGFTDHVNPRTAVGTTQDGRHLLVVTVDGRQTISRGVTLSDLALILKRYGAWNAMNLDGGGSTCMAVGGLVVNSPEGTGSERPVADMLLIDSDRPEVKMVGPSNAGQETGASLILPTGAVSIGDAVPLRIAIGAKTIADSDPRVLWQGMVTNGVGFVNQKGYFIPLKPGTGTVTALFRGQQVSGVVTVKAKTPIITLFSIHADLSPDPGGATNRSELTVRVLDQTGKPQVAAPVTLSGVGGTPDAANLQTDPDGQVTTGVTWDGVSGGTIRVQSGTLAPVVLSQPVR